MKLLALVFYCFAGIMGAQTQVPPPRVLNELKVIDKKVFAEFPARVVANRLACDLTGNTVFLAVSEEELAGYRYVPREQRLTKMAIKDDRIAALFLRDDGALAVVAVEFKGKLVSHVKWYARDGALISDVTLARRMNAAHLAVFPNKRFVLIGGRPALPEEDDERNVFRDAFGAIFDSGGEEVKEIAFPLANGASVPLWQHVSPIQRTTVTSVAHGLLSLGDDGHAYFLLNSVVPVIFVINDEGTVVRSFPLRMKRTDRGNLPTQSMQVSDGKITIAYTPYGPGWVLERFSAIDGTTIDKAEPADLKVMLPVCITAKGQVILMQTNANELTVTTTQLTR